MKQTIPVLIDKKEKVIRFAVQIPVSEFSTGLLRQLDNEAFSFEDETMYVEKKDNQVLIRFSK